MSTPTASFEHLFPPAVRHRLHLRAAIDGPAGSGKTYTALQLARIMVGPNGRIAHVDTESGSAALYAPSPKEVAAGITRLNHWDAPFDFGHMAWDPPYDPRKLTALVKSLGEKKMLGDDGCLIIDSGSAFWDGPGGLLSIVDEATRASRSQNSYTEGWKVGTPIQQALVAAMISAPFHVIFCMRTKTEYVLTDVIDNGRTRTKVEKIGTKPVQRNDLEYEFTVVLDMTQDHTAIVSKTRCSAIADIVCTYDRIPSIGHALADWFATGAEEISDDEVAAIAAAMGPDVYESEQQRIAIKHAFLDRFGNPRRVTTDQLEAVRSWLADLPAPEGPATEPASGPDRQGTEPEPEPDGPVPCPYCGVVGNVCDCAEILDDAVEMLAEPPPVDPG